MHFTLTTLQPYNINNNYSYYNIRLDYIHIIQYMNAWNHPL